MRPVIKTKNFTLRPWRISDAAELARKINDRSISRNMTSIPYPYSLKDAKIFLRKTVKNYSRSKPASINLAIIVENDVAGGAGIHPRQHMAGLGYWLVKEYRGRGIMTDVVGELVKFGFNKLKLKRLVAHVYLTNPASVRVLEKNDFRLEGIARKFAKKGNKYLDCKQYSKVR